MKISQLMILAAAGCLSLSSSTAYAQEREVRKVEIPVPATEQVEVREAQPAQPYRAKQILGGKVSIEGNTAIGTVDDIVFDGDGYVEYLIVDNKGKLVTVPWEAAVFNFEKRTAVVNITSEQYQKIPTYTTERYPVFTAPDYRTEVYRYYGMTPRERRIERRIDRRN